MILETDQHESSVHIDFVPMVDVLFNLLIFFLLATSFHQAEREMQVALPAAQAGGPLSAALREIVINVDSQGVLYVVGRPTAPAELAALIKDAVAANPQQKVSVRGDRRASWSHVVAALDVCKHNGVQEPYLDTVLE